MKKTQMIIYLNENHIETDDKHNDWLRALRTMRNVLDAIIHESRNRMKEINLLWQMIHYYRRTKGLMRKINNMADHFSIMNIIREAGSMRLLHCWQ